MSALDVAVLVLMAVGLVAFLGEPLVRQEAGWDAVDGHVEEAEHLTLHKETLYMAIRDLDFDYQTGKVDQPDYADLRQRLEEEAITTLRQLDAVDPLAALDNELERQIASLRKGHPGADDLATPETCQGCGVPVQDEANFCAFCGWPLRRQSEEEAS